MSQYTALALICGLVLGLGLLVLVTPTKDISLATRQRRPFPWRHLLLSCVLAVGVFALVDALSGVLGLSIVLGGLAASGPPWLRARREQIRRRESEASFPDVIETMLGRIRSGDTVMVGLGSAAGEAPALVADPAKRFSEWYRLTGNADVCLDGLKAEWASPSGDLVVETVRIAHATGGANTVDVLRELADHVRGEQNLRRDIEAKRSWVRVAARVGVAAPWVVLIVLSFRAEAVTTYNSPAGLLVLAVGLALCVGAYWFMVALGRGRQRERVFSS